LLACRRKVLTISNAVLKSVTLWRVAASQAT